MNVRKNLRIFLSLGEGLMDKKLKFWMNVIILICALILFVSGYLLGHLLSKDRECVNNPLIYGIEKFNEANYVSYGCNCYPEGSVQRAFYFSKEGIELDIIEITLKSNQNFLSSLNSSLN